MSEHTPPFMTDAEVEELTGLVQPAAQERWLKENGIKCYRNARNKVRVSRDALSLMRSGAKMQRTEPDFTKVRRSV